MRRAGLPRIADTRWDDIPICTPPIDLLTRIRACAAGTAASRTPATAVARKSGLLSIFRDGRGGQGRLEAGGEEAVGAAGRGLDDRPGVQARLEPARRNRAVDADGAA